MFHSATFVNKLTSTPLQSVVDICQQSMERVKERREGTVDKKGGRVDFLPPSSRRLYGRFLVGSPMPLYIC